MKKNKTSDLSNLLLSRSKKINIMEEKIVKAQTAELILPNKQVLTVGRWRCDPKYRNRLVFDDQHPLLAIELQYRYNEINWSAGIGWPYYHVPCPTGGNMHKILWDFGGITTGSNTMEGQARGNRVTEVIVYVFDDKYDDNVGYFDVDIIGYKQT
jgi:hypothetical protein